MNKAELDWIVDDLSRLVDIIKRDNKKEREDLKWLFAPRC